MKKNRCDMAAALNSLAPDAVWVYFDEDYDTIEWHSQDIIKPSKKEVEDEMQRLAQNIENEKQQADAKEQALAIAKQSALQKLSALGLTEEEAKAIIGI